MSKLSKSAVIFICVVLSGILFFKFYITTGNTGTRSPTIVLSDIPVDFIEQVKPVLAQRCVVCHACYDAPCQLKLGSAQGIDRGANKDRVYDGERLVEANLTRLFEDAHTLQQWRDKAFFPVVSDDPASANGNENLASSVMAELLEMKQQHPLPAQALLPSQFELNLNREYQCPSIDEINDYKEDYPLWGMPYGLPKISQEEHALLNQWIGQGAKSNDNVNLSKPALQNVQDWEAFFNHSDLKRQLMSRYLFEHLFLVNLYFEDDKPQQFFKLVRSATPPGTKVKAIYTRRPFDDPQVERIYYRLLPVQQTLVHKSHMPIALNKARMQKWQSWFIDSDYKVNELPTYLPEEASNPFITFAQIPVKSRYKYMLDEAHNTIMQFIKGPVCRGQMALNVINDFFWVVFIDPDHAFLENNDQFLQQARKNIALPAEEESTTLPTAWIKYAAQERDYLHAKSAFIEETIVDKVPIDLDLIWDGNGVNENLALTIFRHNDAASVVKGLIGEQPQTAWVLTYPLFERIHYLLVAGYDVYGNLGHQLNSRMYMDFLRMEGEFNFLSLLPRDAQKKVRDTWYRGSVSRVEKIVNDANTHLLASSINYKTNDPLQELYSLIQDKVVKVKDGKRNKEKGFRSEEALQAFSTINKLVGNGLHILPESTIVHIYNEAAHKHHYYTMLRHSAYSNISHLFEEEDRRLPNEDKVTIVSGFITSHPNAFMQIKESELGDFAALIQGIENEADYKVLMDKYGIRRTNDDFWTFSDDMHEYFRRNYPVQFGYLDFNRLENR